MARRLFIALLPARVPIGAIVVPLICDVYLRKTYSCCTQVRQASFVPLPTLNVMPSSS
ncbi:MAG: hypothetical protein ACUVR7_15245 [Armatimonadota bacterium]